VAASPSSPRDGALPARTRTPRETSPCWTRTCPEARVTCLPLDSPADRRTFDSSRACLPPRVTIFTTPNRTESAACPACGSVGRAVSFMPHSKHVVPSPHPQNPGRTHTVILNTDCPRCGGSLGGLGIEPDDLLHCVHCRSALHSCFRIEDGNEDRSINIVSIAWLEPARLWTPFSADCGCVGCESARSHEEG
jgi:ribosomal protein S27AE